MNIYIFNKQRLVTYGTKSNILTHKKLEFSKKKKKRRKKKKKRGREKIRKRQKSI